MRLLRVLAACGLCIAASTAAVGEEDSNQTRPYGIQQRTLWTTSRVVGSPEPPTPYRLERSFANLKFKEPVYLIAEPGGERLFLLQYKGKILTFQDDQDAKETALFHDMKRNTYSVTFHPDYETNGLVYVFSNGPKDEKDTRRHNRISRFETTGPSPRSCTAESETIVIEWASGGHDGGDMLFGPDGYLYITAGDGTSDSDTHNTGQNITDLPSGVLRIDVDHPDAGRPYGIPKDNPFLQINQARGELWAFGFRNPWRMSFDEPTGNLWLGDVGQDLWEMIHLVRRGGNYGWSVNEGSHSFYASRKLGPAPPTPPIVEHSHTESRSITGGFVYRGSRLAELVGTYVYCDYETGIVWGFEYEDGSVKNHRVLATSTYKVGSFGRDHAGEIYLVAYSGEILRLRPTAQDGDRGDRFPHKLSETGLFASVEDHTPAAGVIPYSVNAPVWSDGASMERFLAVPGEGKIEATKNRGWNFVDGSVLVQSLALEMEAGNPASRRRIETRLLTRQQGQWQAYTYKWNDEQTDATLVGLDGMDHKFSIEDAAAPGGSRERTWRYSSRIECMGCHSRAANFVLGLSTLQMNRPHDYPAAADNQLRTLDHIGLFIKPLDEKAEKLSHLVDPFDETADLTMRARSYLHANCSHCHVVAGGGNAKMELEFITEPDKTAIFDVTPIQGTFGIPDGKLVARGDPYRSVLLYRISKLGRGRMPHLGSVVVDERAVSLFHDWIAQLPAGGEEADAGDAVARARADQRGSLDELRSAASGEDRAQSAGRLLSLPSGAMMLLRAVTEGTLEGSAQQEAVELATTHPDPRVRDLFERFLPEEKRVRRLGSEIEPEAILSLTGDAAAGQRLFFKTTGVQCQNCHRIGNEGKQLGPDLNKVGKNFNRAQLLETILQPSKVIDTKFLVYLVETVEGRIHTGLLVEKTAELVVLKDDQHNLIRIPVDDVELLLPQQKSIMPELLLRDMTAQQVADLLEFLGTLQ